MKHNLNNGLPDYFIVKEDASIGFLIEVMSYINGLHTHWVCLHDGYYIGIDDDYGTKYNGTFCHEDITRFKNNPVELSLEEFIRLKKSNKPYNNVTCKKIRTFPSGAVRSDNTGRCRPDMVSPYGIEEISMVLIENQNYFGALNYLKGLPEDVCLESLCRHVEEAKEALYIHEDKDLFRKIMRSVGFNAIAALHTIVLKEKELYKEEII